MEISLDHLDDSDNMSDPQDSVQSDSPDPCKDPNTPSPSISGSLSLSHSLSHRQPRKSTLTQQQKNQKRQRATQDQLMTLEVEFNKNPTPTALVRERIAQDINMTERSVQIWFQNRRAKIKNMARKSIENGEDCESIPESMRRHLALQALDTGKLFFSGIGGAKGTMTATNGGAITLDTEAGNGKVVIQHFNCRSLSIGTWRRVGQSQMDLIIFYSPEKACVTYYINNDSAGYKIEYPFAWIKNINLMQGEANADQDGASQPIGHLVVELNRPPKFYMDGSGGGGFYECSDFTEDQQASRVMTHMLGGPSKILSGQLAKLVSLDTFQNRYLLNPALTVAPVSTPVSPITHRPASQPNHLVHPISHISLYPEHQSGLMGPPAPRGHKRQRSRSVPAAVDFSMLRQPMPSFVMQQTHGAQTPATQVADPTIFAPTPVHLAQNANLTTPSSTNHMSVGGLSINTAATYGMDLRHFNGPMSGTTLNSPSDFGTPAFFTSGPSQEGLSAHAYSTPVTGSFLNIGQDAMIGTSNTPLSFVSGDPVIADHSPPFTGLGRGEEAEDIFGTPGEYPILSEDTISLEATKPVQLKGLGDLAYNNPGPYSDDTFSFSPPLLSKVELPYRNGHESDLAFQTPTHHGTNPMQRHQDSGIAFTLSQDQGMYHTPKDRGAIAYQQNSALYRSPAVLGDSSSTYQTPATRAAQRFQTPASQQRVAYQSPPATGNKLDDLQENHLSGFAHYGSMNPTSL